MKKIIPHVFIFFLLICIAILNFVPYGKETSHYSSMFGELYLIDIMCDGAAWLCWLTILFPPCAILINIFLKKPALWHKIIFILFALAALFGIFVTSFIMSFYLFEDTKEYYPVYYIILAVEFIYILSAIIFYFPRKIK